jgi:hypothetical protein
VVLECTDCMAFVSTPNGGYEGLPTEVAENLRREKITPLPYETVRTLCHDFESLNSSTAVKAILEPKLKTNDRQIYCRAVAANLHAFFEYSDGKFKLLNEEGSYSAHTLGCYLSPKGEDRESHEWIGDAWEGRTQGWEKIPAAQHFVFSTRKLMRRVAKYNEGKPWRDEVRPFSHFIKFQAARCRCGRWGFEESPGLLIAPWEKNPEKWMHSECLRIPQLKPDTDPDPPRMTDIVTLPLAADTESEIVVSYADIAEGCHTRKEYRHSDRDGNDCERGTRGVLLPVRTEITGLDVIGKQSNDMALINLGMARADEIYTNF